MDLGIEGKVALVTAGSRGLGRATALALAAEGVRVMLSGRDPATLEATRQEVAAIGGSVDAVRRGRDGSGSAGPPRRGNGRAVRCVGHPGRQRRRAAVPDGPWTSAMRTSRPRSTPTCSPRCGWCEKRYRTCGRRAGAGSAASRRTPSRRRHRYWHSPTRPAPVCGRGSRRPPTTLRPSRAGSPSNMACPGPHATDRMKQLGGSGAMGDPSDFGAVVTFLCSAQAAFVNGSAVVVDGGATLAL